MIVYERSNDYKERENKGKIKKRVLLVVASDGGKEKGRQIMMFFSFPFTYLFFLKKKKKSLSIFQQ